MIAAGVPVVPGTEQILAECWEAVMICNKIGYPVMLKASMGGGGKGMRLIHSEDEVVEAYNTARSSLCLLLVTIRYIWRNLWRNPIILNFRYWVIIMANVIHLFDRECSVQRRNQKIVEESPSPLLTRNYAERWERRL